MKIFNFKGFGDWIEIFTAGKQTDSQGNTREWTEADLDNIVTNYDPQKHEAPLVVGHPKDNTPAFGWIESIKRDGKTLLMKAKDVVPEFEEAVKKGMYKKRSVSFYADGTLRHVGFLGAVPPAVKGLKNIEFKEEETALTYEFAENYRMSVIGRIFQNLRDWIIETYDKETADKVINQWDVDGIKERIEEPSPLQNGLFNEGNNNFKSEEEMTIEQLQARIKELEKQNSDFSEAGKTKDEQIKQLQNELGSMKKAALAKELNEFCEGLIKEGKLVPAKKDMVIKQLEIAAQSGAELNFSEDGTDKKVTALESLKTLLKESPIVVDFSERAKNGSTHNGISAEAEEGKKIADSLKNN